MEDDLKILKVEYLSNHWLDLPQILNLSSGDQTKIKNALNEDDLWWRWPPMEEDLQWKTTFNGRQRPMEDILQSKKTSTNQKLNISATIDRIFLKLLT